MADPTVDAIYAYKNKRTNPIPIRIKNGVQLYLGQLTMLNGGDLDKHAAGAGTVCEGIAIGGGVPGSDPNMDGIVGSNAIAPGNTASSPPPRAIVETGELILEQLSLAVAGTLAGTEADKGTVLYAGAGSSSLLDLSTTQTSTDKPIGEITKFYASAGGRATYDVQVYSKNDRRGM